MIEKIQKKFALTPIGAKNLVKACISCTISYLAIAMSISILYFFSTDFVIPLLNQQELKINYGLYFIEFVIVMTLIYVAH